MADSQDAFFTGLIMGMVKQAGWPAFKALVAKLESQHPSVHAAPPKRPTISEGEPEIEAPLPAPKRWGGR